jgi:L-alanine-DL-glutamate epimerase-like enolase superfamily enzyme
VESPDREGAVTLTVEAVDRTTVELPYREVPAEHLFRTRPAWNYFEVFEVALSDGTVGHGETMLYYTWGETTDAAVDRALGRNAASLLWDESLGAGLQMALFDAVGRALEVPIHSLLGEKVRDRAPHSWWAMDMPTEDWLAECERAIDAGYTNIKVKGRPWRDVRAAFAELSERLPPWFEIDVDFNETLLDAERAVPILEELAQYPQVNIFESPIPEADLEGYRRIREAVDVDIAVHYGTSTLDDRAHTRDVVASEAVDGFVVSDSANGATAQGAVAAMADMRLWLQFVGTGIMTAFACHVGGVLEAAEWPAITCHQLFTETLVEEPFVVEDGETAVPDGPGLGVTVDTDAVEEYAVEAPASKPSPDRLIEVSWPDGRRMYFGNYDPQMLEAAHDGTIPFYERGVSTRLLREDESDRWQRLHERTRDGPVVEP